jgi:hypothetical protein
MMALSIKQPWAWLILQGYKDVENRTWSTTFRCRIYVHAGLKLDSNAYGRGNDPNEFIGYRLGRIRKYDAWLAAHPLRRGVILGEATVVDCVSESKSEWFDGPYGFVLEDPVAYDYPIPYRGRLGFFEVMRLEEAGV